MATASMLCQHVSTLHIDKHCYGTDCAVELNGGGPLMIEMDPLNLAFCTLKGPKDPFPFVPSANAGPD